MRVALVTVVSGIIYKNYARKMMESAEKFFRPSDDIHLLTISGYTGWPWATLYRHHHLSRNMPECDYVFMIDADMRFDQEVGSEILGDGVTATLHPGYVTSPILMLPFECRSESLAYVPIVSRKRYFCGGFVGGTREAYLAMAEKIKRGIDIDIGKRIVATWHDESHLNKYLSEHPPAVTLSPSYCKPADSRYYEQCVWDQSYEAKITALDKHPEERRGR